MSESHPWTIIIAERGFVFVGRVHRDGDKVVIEDAYTVRRFSLETKDGLGGLASHGPRAKSNDVLDAQPTTRVHVMGVVGEIDCNQDAWSKWHAKVRK